MFAAGYGKMFITGIYLRGIHGEVSFMLKGHMSENEVQLIKASKHPKPIGIDVNSKLRKTCCEGRTKSLNRLYRKFAGKKIMNGTFQAGMILKKLPYIRLMKVR